MKTNKYSKGIVDQIILWLVLLTVFVNFFFLVIDYSSIMRVQDNCEDIAAYASKMVTIGKDKEYIKDGINKIKLPFFKTAVAETDIVCNEDMTSNTYQVIFNVTGNYSGVYFNQAVAARRVIYNEINEHEITCNLVLK